MIIGVDFGHTLKGHNYGAVGILHESKETRNIGIPLIKYLEDLGHTVINVTVDYAESNNDSINVRVNNANKHKLDLLVSIHLNAFDGTGHGVEVLTHQGKYLIEADRILKNIEKLGYRNRGIKNGTFPRKLGIINSTEAPAMIVECFFCDNREDVNIYDPKEIAKAIVEGITNTKIGDDEVVKKEVKNNVPSKWAEESWKKAVEQNINDGIGPKDSVTEEQLMVFFDRLGLLDKGGNK